MTNTSLASGWRSLDNPSLFLRMAESRLKVNLEPLVDSRSGRLIAVEALMRGAADIGFKTPHHLLDHASRLGVLTDLEILLAQRAIRTVETAIVPRPRLFLNIDGRTLPDWKRYRDMLVFELERSDMTPAEIVLEISETQQVLEGPALQTAIEGLRASGFRIAIDDFGTGVSGLQMLYHVQPNFLKIDRFFVQAMPSDAHKRMLVHAITRLAHTLGARVVAEGVETPEELQACRQADCGLIQGYLLKGPDVAFETVATEYDLPGGQTDDTPLDRQLAEVLQTPPTVTPDVTLRELFELFGRAGDANLVPVLDPSGMLVGGLLWSTLRPILGSPFGDALARNHSFRFPIRHLIVQVPTIEVRQPLAQALDLVADRARDGVMVTDRGDYVGYLSPYDLMQLANTVMLTEAQRRNPLTGLPGNEAIAERVRDYGSRMSEPRLLAYFDISNFKPFNDRFGFELGDRAILLLSDQLKRLADISGAFVGHIGGDDFFLGYEGRDIQGLRELFDHAPGKFRDAISGLVPDHVQANGCYLGRTRTGEEECIPLPGITLVTQVFDVGETVPDPQVVAQKLAALKIESRRNAG